MGATILVWLLTEPYVWSFPHFNHCHLLNSMHYFHFSFHFTFDCSLFLARFVNVLIVVGILLLVFSFSLSHFSLSSLYFCSSFHSHSCNILFSLGLSLSSYFLLVFSFYCMILTDWFLLCFILTCLSQFLVFPDTLVLVLTISSENSVLRPDRY